MRANGEANRGAPTVTLIHYDADAFQEEELHDLDGLEAKLEEAGVHWLNVANAGSDHEVIRRVAEAVRLHPLALDDVLHEGQRPRAEEYGDHLFMLMRMLLVQDMAVPPSADSAQGTRADRAAGAALDGRSPGCVLHSAACAWPLWARPAPSDRNFSHFWRSAASR